MLSLRLNADPEFEALAQFVRDFAGLDLSVDITPSTLFEDDLGITGDDGGELLEAVAQHYSSLLRTVEHFTQIPPSMQNTDDTDHLGVRAHVIDSDLVKAWHWPGPQTRQTRVAAHSG